MSRPDDDEIGVEDVELAQHGVQSREVAVYVVESGDASSRPRTWNLVTHRDPAYLRIGSASMSAVNYRSISY